MPNAMHRAAPLLIVLCAALSACNFNPEPPTPTVEQLTPSPSPSAEVTLTPSTTVTAPPTVNAIRLASATPSETAEAPAETATPTPTPGPYVVRVQPGDTLYGIIDDFGYRDDRVFPAILALNPNIPSVSNLPVGQEILIPRMTPTPTPPNYEATVSIMLTLNIPLPDQLPENTEFQCHAVREGETIVDIAEEHNTTLEIISRYNPEISFFGCDFNIRSGGPECGPIIRPGQCVTVPMATPTATLSPTPSGDETATPTPTYGPPPVISPPNGGIVGGPLMLQWVSVGVLRADEHYYVEMTNRTAGTQNTWVTKGTSLSLPLDLVPPEGQQHDIEWRVVVVRGSGDSFSVIGGVMPARTFKWQRR